MAGRQIANIRYDEVEGRVVAVKTTVVPEFRGRGIAEELTAYALDDIRDRGMRVTVYCPYVTRSIKRGSAVRRPPRPAVPGPLKHAPTQIMAVSTPPSALTAAPFVADESGLAR